MAWLLTKGAKITDLQDFLVIAVARGDAKLVEWLLSYGLKDVGGEALEAAEFAKKKKKKKQPNK